MPIEQQVVVIYGAVRGYLDNVEISDIAAFEEGALAKVDPSICDTIKKDGEITDATEAKLKEFYTNYTASFLAAKEQ